jgi:6-pyruvoyltetrahydropterin/6-carboxytetrahydropterin synthase
MKPVFQSTKVMELGSCAFRQWRASHSHCRFLHGYQLKAKLWFSCSSLDDKGWAVDFGGLKELKATLNNLFDHTTTIAADDPSLDIFKDLDSRGLIQLRIMDKGVGIERAAETVFELADKHVRSLTDGRCWVNKVEVFEHEDNSAVYTESNSAVEQETIKTTYSFNAEADLQPAVTTPVETVTQQQSAPNRGAAVGNGVSQGMSNPFAGTSWGA